MSGEIIISLISLVGTIGGSCTGVLVAGKLTNYRLSRLEEKVNQLGGIRERLALVEQSVQSAHKRMDGAAQPLRLS